MDNVIVTIGAAILIVGIELILWHLFRMRVADLCFDPSLDRSSFRWLSVPRLRAFAITHTLFLTLTTGAFLFFTW